MWSEKYDSDLFLAEIVWMIRSRDHAWSSHRQFFFWSSNLTFSEWRMSILDYQVTYVCSRFVERRLWWDVELDETSHQSETTYQTWRKRLIKLDEKERHLIKIDQSAFSSNLRSSSHQTFEKRDNSLLSDERSHAATHDVKNLVLQKITFRFVRK
jgi:hypothetical protein